VTHWAVHQYQATVNVIHTAVHDVAKAATVTADFVKAHAAAIASVVVSTAVFIGCDAALGVATGGVGAVAGAMACGALAGAAGNAVSYGITAAQTGKFSWSGLTDSALSGAVTGAVAGGLGAGFAEAAGAVTDAASGLLSGGAAADAADAATDAAADGAEDDGAASTADSADSAAQDPATEETAPAGTTAEEQATQDASAPTGARGPSSGRGYDPAKAGGPIEDLDASSATITHDGVDAVAAHLQRFVPEGSELNGPEQGMLDRLTSITSGETEPTIYDQNFYTHELQEASRYANIGYGPGSAADLGSSDMYDVWNNVHTASLEDYGINDDDLFYPGVK
jgi:hypothetical protein